MSHPADILPDRPTPETHERVGSVWVPKEEVPLPTSEDLARAGKLGPPLVNANEFMEKLDGDSKIALAKIIDPASTGDVRNFWAGVLYMSGRAQHRLIFKVEPPIEDGQETSNANEA